MHFHLHWRKEREALGFRQFELLRLRAGILNRVALFSRAPRRPGKARSDALPPGFAAELSGAVLAARPGAATGPTDWDEADPRTEDDRLDLAAPRLEPPLHNRPAP